MTRTDECITGVVVPLLAPVTADEQLDEAAFQSLIRRCINGGANALLAGGSAGMGPLWPLAQWERMMEVAHDAVAGAVPLLGGAIETSTRRTIERIRVLERTGIAHVVVTPTFYLKLERDEEFLAHFGACREATDLNLIAYNIPSCTQASIPLSVLETMGSRGWMRGLKESSGDRAYFSHVMERFAGTNIAVLQGHEPYMAQGLRDGAAGVVPVCANYAPEVYRALVDAVAAGNDARAEALQDEIMKIRATLLLGDKNWVSGAAYGLHTLGIGSGAVLRPLQTLGAAERGRIERMTAARMRSGEQTP